MKLMIPTPTHLTPHTNMKSLTTKTIALIVLLLIIPILKIYAQGGSLSSTNTRSIPRDLFGFNGANVITLNDPCSGSGIGGSCFQIAISNYTLNSFRYPAGSVSNYWDWYEGWFLENKFLPNGYILPTKFENFSIKDCKIETFNQVINATCATPIFNLNLMLSDKYYQAAMLYRARAMNLGLQNIELGNEFYNEKKLHVKKYADATNYEIDADEFRSFILTHFDATGLANPIINTATVGAVADDQEPSFSRRNLWLDEISNIPTSSDAITLHNYISIGLGTDAMALDGSNLHVVFFNCLTNMLSSNGLTRDPTGSMRAALHTIALSSSSDKEVWVTEYNFEDGGHLMAGTWAHGLFTLTMALTYLESDKISKIDCHALIGDASTGVLFQEDMKGFESNNPNGSYYKDGIPACSTSHWQTLVPTTAYSPTACGTTLKLLADATKGATNATNIEFSGVDAYKLQDIEGANQTDGIYGWFFEKPNDYTAVILNLSGANVASFDALTNIFTPPGFATTFDVETYFPSQGLSANEFFDIGTSCNPASSSFAIAGVLNAVTGIYTASGYTDYADFRLRQASHYSRLGISISDLQSITLNAYSVSIIKMSKGSPDLKLYCDNLSSGTIQVCAGSSFSVKSDGTPGYSWTTTSGDISFIQNGDKVTVNVASPATPGTYSVTCADANSVTASIQVQINAPVTVQFTENNPPTYTPLPDVGFGVYHPCPDASGNYNISANIVGSTGNYSAIWFDSDKHGIGAQDITSGNYPVITLNADKPDKIYYIVASDGLCYSGFDSVQIQPYNFIEMKPDYYKCTAGGIGLAVNIPHKDPSATYSYAWSGGLSSVYNPNSFASTNTVYTVTVTVTNSCTATLTASTNVHVETCTCTSSPSCASNCVDIEPGNNAAYIYAKCGVTYPAHIQNKNIYFQGHVFIDKNIYFENCNLYFDKEASFTVIGNVLGESKTRLTLESCLMDASCDSNWSGIILEDPGAFLLMKDGTELHHAEIGVSAFNDARVRITDSEFYDNVQHLYFANFINEAESEINGCRFSSNSGTMYNGYTKTDNCIAIDDVDDIIIGDAGETVNVFENYIGGVYALNSSFQLYHNEFNGNAGYASSIQNVWGVNTQNISSSAPWPETTAIIGTTGTNGGNKFENANGHVEVVNMHASVRFNTFIGSAYALSGSYSRYKTYNIRGNNFEESEHAIHLSMTGNGNITIQNNKTIKVANTGSIPYGIYVGAVTKTTGNAAHLTIKGNEVDTAGQYGIFLQNLDFGATRSIHDTWEGVDSNDVEMNQTSGSGLYGIRLENCTYARISANNVRGLLGTTFTGKTAISLSQCANSIVACNQTTRTNAGLQFIDHCDNADIKNNEIADHDDGLVLGISTGGVRSAISTQPLVSTEDPSNLYIGNGLGAFNQYAIRSYDSYAGVQASGPDIDFSFLGSGGFKVPSSHAYTPVSLSGGSDFKLNAMASFSDTLSCANDLPLLLRLSNGNNNDRSVVKYTKNSDFVLQPNIKPSQNKVNKIDGGEAIINDTITNDGSTTDAFKYVSKCIFYETLKDTAIRYSNPAYVLFFDSASQGNIGKFNTIQQLMYLITDTSHVYNTSALVSLYLDSANTINQGIVPMLIVDENKKAINSLYISKLFHNNYNFNQNEKNIIDIIANQCPYSGGGAVTEARAIRMTYNDSAIYDDVFACAIVNSGFNSRKANNEKDLIKLKAFPNPAKDYLMVESNYFGKDYRLVVTDVIGRRLIEKPLTDMVMKIDIRNLSSGLYNVVIFHNVKQIENRKISIAK